MFDTKDILDTIRHGIITTEAEAKIEGFKGVSKLNYAIEIIKFMLPGVKLEIEFIKKTIEIVLSILKLTGELK